MLCRGNLWAARHVIKKNMPLLRCPHCREQMLQVTRHDVVIDVCPECKGVWLDRGELEKLFARERELSDQQYEPYTEPAGPEPRSKGTLESIFDDIYD